MSAQAILHRYLIRRQAELPVDPSELRKHLASVAERDGLKVTEEELDGLVGRPETGDKETDSAEWRRDNLSGRPENKDRRPETGDRKTKTGNRIADSGDGAKKGRNSRRKPKTGDNTTEAI